MILEAVEFIVLFPQGSQLMEPYSWYTSEDGE